MKHISLGGKHMTHFTARAFLAAMIGLTGLSAAPVAAFADGIYFGFNSGPDMDPGPPGPPPGWRRHHHMDDFGGPPMMGCDQRQALKRAWRMGLDHPQVVRVTPRRIVIEGEGDNGDIRRVQFANVPGCPGGDY
jgi:hypothetical protein